MMIYEKQKAIEIFLRRAGSVIAAAPVGCWEWSGGKCNGRGRIRVTGRDGFMIAYWTHRLSYEHFIGSLGELDCLHYCDNPPCFRPDHLFKGTAKDNAQDRQSKGRQGYTGRSQVGESNANGFLLEVDIEDIIRLRHDERWLLREIADEYSISVSHASCIVRGLAWRSVSSKGT